MSNDVRNVKVTLTVPEDLVAAYEDRGVTTNVAMVRTLKAASKINFDERPIIVPKDARLDIEAIAETTVENAQQLTELIKNLLRINVGDVQILLTERQAEKLRELSTFYDEDVNEYTETKVSEAIDYVLGEW